MSTFKVGEVVKGRVCGVFRVRGFRTVGSVEMLVLKEVHPDDHSVEAKGTLCLPLTSVVPL